MSRRSLLFKLIIFALLLYIASGAYAQWQWLNLWEVPSESGPPMPPIEFNGIPYDSEKMSTLP
ncbi:MAG: hypothetical protein HC800_02845 [Phormidesmis sp. RL_2_1]|nr:hypothetical protein [Phormidesmis sp. RL_2_1]